MDTNLVDRLISSDESLADGSISEFDAACQSDSEHIPGSPYSFYVKFEPQTKTFWLEFIQSGVSDRSLLNQKFRIAKIQGKDQYGRDRLQFWDAPIRTASEQIHRHIQRFATSDRYLRWFDYFKPDFCFAILDNGELLIGNPAYNVYKYNKYAVGGVPVRCLWVPKHLRFMEKTKIKRMEQRQKQAQSQKPQTRLAFQRR